MDYLILVVLFVLSLAMMFAPEAVFKLEQKLRRRDDRMEEAYLIAMRLFGLFFLLFALGGGVYMLFT